MVGDLDDFREAYSQWWKEAIESIQNNMTDDMAQFIKEKRCVEDYTWRSVARSFCEEYPKFAKEYGLQPSNQISGMQLCESAQIKLNENEQDNNWN